VASARGGRVRYFAMPAWDQSRRFGDVPRMSGLPQTADISGLGRHFAFVPKAVIQLADSSRQFPTGRRASKPLYKSLMVRKWHRRSTATSLVASAGVNKGAQLARAGFATFAMLSQGQSLCYGSGDRERRSRAPLCPPSDVTVKKIDSSAPFIRLPRSIPLPTIHADNARTT
jgi:hypothetical protein